ncbi:hypothetical protein [uncultured Hydrogenophaga sp.]|uniref:hypothetical protein n=1 Tax=uncultured Hydrogenophaga sp. TaxID=199683 RepID=UPI00265F437A|nr:hypothetical protein [uncultured Hydrogenophaga sp.]
MPIRTSNVAPVTRPATALAIAGVALALAACSPAFNWRTVRPDASALQALMPCKPDEARRDTPLGGAVTPLNMLSCEAGGATFAMAWADLGQAERVPAALVQWRAASLISLKAAPEAARSWTQPVPGAERVDGIDVQGVRHDGSATRARVLYFARGARVYQAAIYGSAVGPEEVSTFFEGLQLP